MITGIWISFQEGNIFSFIRVLIANFLDKWNPKLSKYIQKPLWDCMPCMGSFWTIVLSWSFNIPLILAVVGALVVICNVIHSEEKIEHYDPLGPQINERFSRHYHDDIPTLRP
jgi:hypothetical protein